MKHCIICLLFVLFICKSNIPDSIYVEDHLQNDMAFDTYCVRKNTISTDQSLQDMFDQLKWGLILNLNLYLQLAHKHDNKHSPL